MDYAVTATSQAVSAWSIRRLVFEPKGWQRDFRDELRAALRGLQAQPGQVLLAEYDAPDDEVFDVEKVLLYNVGSGAYSHLCEWGIVCRRKRSTDGRHHVRYTPPLPWRLIPIRMRRGWWDNFMPISALACRRSPVNGGRRCGRTWPCSACRTSRSSCST